jgi:ribosomal protein L24E
MARCHTCGNDYDKAFEVRKDGETFVFNSLECAAHALAPSCAACGVRVLGHGHEAAGRMFCSAHCATGAGATELRDRA